MTSWPLLSFIIFLPLVGVFFISLVQEEAPTARDNIRWLALLFTLLTLALSLFVWAKFDPTNPDFQMVEYQSWIGQTIAYHLGIDGISVLFIVLTALLMPLCVLASWTVIKDRLREYMIAFLLLETLIIGVFCALDLALFYLFFEGGLIPMFIIIGVWGGERRIYASFKFFLYTLLGSVLMLIAILTIYWQTGTTNIVTLLNTAFPPTLQIWLWLAFFASFAVKIPMWPFHTWLPDAHVEAPTAGSVILAGILLKLGGYGFLRFSLSLFPYASDIFAEFVFILSVIAIIYTSLVALVQEDMKKLIAYSSVAHMGYVTIGIFTGVVSGLQGSVFQMISHGFISSALFLCVGVVYDRMHTREIAAYGGLVERMPFYAAVFMILTLANVGLPGTSGFIGEFYPLLAAFVTYNWVAFLGALGVIFSAAYALVLYRQVMFGPLKKERLKTISDISLREKMCLVPLVALTLLFGFYPAPILQTSQASVEKIVHTYEKALVRYAQDL